MIELGKLQDGVHRCTFHRRSVAYPPSHTARACLWHMRLRHAPLPQNKSTPCSSSIYDHLHIFWFLMFIITVSRDKKFSCSLCWVFLGYPCGEKGYKVYDLNFLVRQLSTIIESLSFNIPTALAPPTTTPPSANSGISYIIASIISYIRFPLYIKLISRPSLPQMSRLLSRGKLKILLGKRLCKQKFRRLKQ